MLLKLLLLLAQLGIAQCRGGGWGGSSMGPVGPSGFGMPPYAFQAPMPYQGFPQAQAQRTLSIDIDDPAAETWVSSDRKSWQPVRPVQGTIRRTATFFAPSPGPTYQYHIHVRWADGQVAERTIDFQWNENPVVAFAKPRPETGAKAPITGVIGEKLGKKGDEPLYQENGHNVYGAPLNNPVVDVKLSNVAVFTDDARLEAEAKKVVEPVSNQVKAEVVNTSSKGAWAAGPYDLKGDPQYAKNHFKAFFLGPNDINGHAIELMPAVYNLTGLIEGMRRVIDPNLNKPGPSLPSFGNIDVELLGIGAACLALVIVAVIPAKKKKG